MTSTFDDQVEAAEARWAEAWATGPTRLRWETLPPQVGDAAPDARLEDHRGVETSLADLWAGQPLLILFWRHFGCSCGIDRAARLRSEIADYRAAGGDAVIVAQGESARAARYRELHGLDAIHVPVLADPERLVYQAYGMLQGTPAQVLFDASDELQRCDLDAGMAMAAGRHGTPRASVDDPWQLPGEVVVGTDGIIRLVHRYGWCEDYPDPRIHVSAIRAAAGRL